jgi:hypothetical protein
MNPYSGCWVEFHGRQNWVICWPDCTVLEGGFRDRKAAVRALLFYMGDAVLHGEEEQTAPEP